MFKLRLRASHLSLVLAVASLGVAGIVGACSPADDPSTLPYSTLDGSTDDAATPSPDASSLPDSSTPDASTVCNAMTTTSLTPVKESATLDPAPTPMGGTVEDGDYVGESSIAYDAPVALGPVDSGFVKISLKAGTAQIVFNSAPDRSLPDRTQTETWTFSGTNVTTTRTCPSALAGVSHPYSVETSGGKTTLVIFGTDKGKTTATRLVKQ